jgi:hypothetical protein
MPCSPLDHLIQIAHDISTARRKASHAQLPAKSDGYPHRRAVR